MHIIKNTDKSYPCTNCGSENVSIVREDSQNPRLKCNTCNFMFSGQDSIAAKESGGLKGSSEEDLALASDPEVYTIEEKPEAWSPAPRTPTGEVSAQLYTSPKAIPRSPAYLFIAKDRMSQEIVSLKDFKKTVLKWEQRGKYDCYQLSAKQVGVKVEIDE